MVLLEETVKNPNRIVDVPTKIWTEYMNIVQKH
jgi:hypothetical protein